MMHKGGCVMGLCEDAPGVHDLEKGGSATALAPLVAR
jgi:hypothetical protein